MSKRMCSRCGYENGAEGHICDPSAYQLANQKAARMHKTLNKLVEKMGGDDNNPADWMDSWGCCKICSGEIPHGHHSNCYVYTTDNEIKELKEQIKVLEDEVARLQ